MSSASGSSPRLFAYGMLASIATMWGSSFVLMKVLSEDLPPFAATGLRGLVATATLILFFILSGRSLRLRRAEIWPGIVLGVLQGFAPTALMLYAVADLGAGLGAMLQTSTPLLTAILAQALGMDERIDARRGLGLALGFLGVGLLIGLDAMTGGRATALPIAAALASGLCYAIGNVYVRGLPPLPARSLAIGQQSVTAVAGLGLSLLLEPAAAFARAPARWLEILAFGSIASAVPLTLFLTLIQRSGPVRAAMVGYLAPVVATVLSTLLLGEILAPRQILGGAIILVGVALVSAAPRPAPA